MHIPPKAGFQHSKSKEIPIPETAPPPSSPAAQSKWKDLEETMTDLYLIDSPYTSV